MNELEKTLIGWKPRRPSAGLESRLFTAPREPQYELRHWFAPAMACALAIGMFLSGHAIKPASWELPSNPNLAMLGLTNGNLPLFAMRSDNLHWNLCSKASLAIVVPEKEESRSVQPTLIASTN